MPKLRIKSGDTVVVTAGKEKGKQGKVLAAFPSENKVMVDGVNVATKSKKPRSAQDKGGLVKVTQKIDVSNVMLVCPGCKKPSRTGVKIVKDEKVRFCKKCGKSIVGTKVAKEAKAEVSATTKEAKAVKAEPKVKAETKAKTETKKAPAKAAEAKK